MAKHKLPHPFSWYYKSFEVEGKCPFCGSETVYSTRNNDALFCRHYACYVSVYDCESYMSGKNDKSDNIRSGCEACSLEPVKYCPIEKTSIYPSDCEKVTNPRCETCKSIIIDLPNQGELRSELVWVCDDCQKVVDFANLKVSDKFSS
jgi:hypothetical protein